MKRLAFAAAATALVAVVLASSAFSAPVNATRGDAEAVFNALGTGGYADILHSPVAKGAPVDLPGDARIAIRPLSNVDQGHYCSLDWHALEISVLDGGDTSFTRNDADYLSSIGVTLTLDGTPLVLRQTPLKPAHDAALFGVDVLYAVTWGSLVAPGVLAPRVPHTLAVVLAFEGNVFAADQSTFYLDAPGEGTCS
jgi:hypothetical protein